MRLVRLQQAALFLSLLTTTIEGARDCSTRNQPITEIARDSVTGEYVVVGEVGSRRRRLGGGGDESASLGPSSLTVSRRRAQTDDMNGDVEVFNATYDEVFEMRRCPCSRDERGDTYCNVKNWVCLIPRNSSENAWCEAPTTKQRFVGNVFPAVWFWYLILVLGACTSNYGRQISGYFLSFCFRKRNERLVDEMLLYNPNQANWLLRRYLRRSRARGEAPILFPVNFDPTTLFQWFHAEQEDDDDDGDIPNALALRTKIYSDSDTAVQRTLNDENEFNCTICFAIIQEGDRVGELPCNHAFHVDCLKTWLKRRNACPLCQYVGIAEPRYDASVASTAASTFPQQDSTTATDENDAADATITPQELHSPQSETTDEASNLLTVGPTARTSPAVHELH